MSAAEQLDVDDALDAQLDAYVAEMWRKGDLSWKLDEHQKRVYDQYREWESIITDARNATLHPALFKGLRRAFVMDIGRRWGKTFLVALIRIEDCIRRPRQIITYATAFQKDIGEIIQPMVDEICADAPDDVCPKFQRSFGVQTMAYRFRNDSILKLVGIDKNPKGLRGRASDGFNVTEAGHVPKLATTIGNVIYPQFQRRDHATLILESNAPELSNHDFDRVFIPDARARAQNDNGISPLVELTIDDNEAISAAEKAEFIDAAMATDPYAAAREYFGERVRDPRIMVIPDFDKARHVVPPPEMPEYAMAAVAMDPGEEDPCGVIFGYWDFMRAKFVVQRSRAESNWRTGSIADYIKTTEAELWQTPRYAGPRPQNDKGYKQLYKERQGHKFEAPPGLWYWDGEKFAPNPGHRWSDTDAHMIGDLAVEHGLIFTPTEKDDSIAHRNLLREAFNQGLIEICEDAGPIINQLQHGQFRQDTLGKSVDWIRTPALGHLDCLAALIYLWRMFTPFRFRNPNPPAVVDLKASNVSHQVWHGDNRTGTTEHKLRDAIRGKRLTRWSPRR